MLANKIGLLVFVCLFYTLQGDDPLSSWNDGPAKQAIIDFVKSTTDVMSTYFVPPDERIAAFDQDGTLWVEHPIPTQLKFCLDRIPEVVQERPELKEVSPFKTVLSGNREAFAKFTSSDLEIIAMATLTGMSVDQFRSEVLNWIKKARHPRWHRSYTELTYQPMQDVLKYLNLNGYKTYIVTGGGQDFVRVYAQKTYGIPPEQIVGTTTGVEYKYDQNGKPILIKDPKLLFYDNNSGKPEGIHIMIGRRPYAAFGNSTGDREMLEYTKSGSGLRLAMLVLHDDPVREYAYGPAENLPNTQVGTFTQALYDEAKKNGWIIISMRQDWRKIFSFE